MIFKFMTWDTVTHGVNKFIELTPRAAGIVFVDEGNTIKYSSNDN